MASSVKLLIGVIKEKCLECMAGQQNEIRLCPVDRCPLWPYRLGDPNKRTMTDEEKAQRTKQLETARLARKSLMTVRDSDN